MNYRKFNLARNFVRRMKFKDIHDWEVFIDGKDTQHGPFPADMPVWPPNAYDCQGWKSWQDFLGVTIPRHTI